MSQNKLRFWSMVLFLLLCCLFSFTSTVLADDGTNPTQCQFQPSPSDRSSTMDSIFLIGAGGENLTWDNSYLGLHRWTFQQWPGVDYTVPTTIAFTSGGTISWLGIDGAGGGYSIIIDGANECQGWRQFIGHLAYDPSSRYVIGQEIGPSEIVGEPGCSGFEAYCTPNGGSIPPHNHTTLGYQSNVFSFSDGTQAVGVRGYWWIHPARVEGTAVSSPGTEKQISFDASLEYSAEFTIPEVSQSINPDFLDNLLIGLTPYKTHLKVAASLLGLAFIGLFFISKDFRGLTIAGLVIAVILAGGIFYLRQSIAKSPVFSPPREAIFVAEVPEKTVTFDISETTSLSSSANTVDADCQLPVSYPDTVLRYCDLIEKYAAEQGVDPQLIAAVMVQESHGNPDAYSSAGAVGLLQVMPHDGLAANFMCANGPCFANRPSMDELYEEEFNVSYGTRMLAGLINKYDGSEREALFHYGPAGVGYYYADIVLAIKAKNQ